MRLLLFGSGVYALLLIIGGLFEPFFLTRGRYYILSFPFLCIGVWAYARVLPRWWKYGFVALAILAIAYQNYVRFRIPGWRHSATLRLVQEAKPDLIVFYINDKHAQELNAYYYNGLRVPEKMAVWYPRNPENPPPNPSFRHLLGEELETVNSLPSAATQQPRAERTVVMMEKSVEPEALRQEVLNRYRRLYAHEQVLADPGSHRRYYAAHLFTRPTQLTVSSDEEDGRRSSQ